MGTLNQGYIDEIEFDVRPDAIQYNIATNAVKNQLSQNLEAADYKLCQRELHKTISG